MLNSNESGLACEKMVRILGVLESNESGLACEQLVSILGLLQTLVVPGEGQLHKMTSVCTSKSLGFAGHWAIVQNNLL